MTVRSGGIKAAVDPEHAIRSETKDGGLAGLRVDLSASQWLGFEFDIAGSWAQHVVRLYSSLSLPPGEPPVESSTQLSDAIFTMHAGPVFHLVPVGPVRPYVAGGLGFVAFVENREFAYRYAAGLDLDLSPRLGLRIEGRRSHTKLNGEIVEVVDVLPDGTLVGIRFPFEDRVTLTSGTAGLRLRF